MSIRFFSYVQAGNLEPDILDELTRIHSGLNRHEAILTDEDIEGQLVNDSGGALSIGDIFGVSSSGLVLARSGGTRASGIAKELVRSGETFVPSRFGLQYTVNVESGITISPGDKAFLSDSVAGSATNTAPTGIIQFLGIFLTVRNDSNQAEIQNLITARDVGL